VGHFQITSPFDFLLPRQRPSPPFWVFDVFNFSYPIEFPLMGKSLSTLIFTFDALQSPALFLPLQFLPWFPYDHDFYPSRFFFSRLWGRCLSKSHFPDTRPAYACPRLWFLTRFPFLEVRFELSLLCLVSPPRFDPHFAHFFLPLLFPAGHPPTFGDGPKHTPSAHPAVCFQSILDAVYSLSLFLSANFFPASPP